MVKQVKHQGILFNAHAHHFRVKLSRDLAPLQSEIFTYLKYIRVNKSSGEIVRTYTLYINDYVTV